MYFIHLHLLYPILHGRVFPVQPDHPFSNFLSVLHDILVVIVTSSGDPTVPLQDGEARLLDHAVYYELDAVTVEALERYGYLAQRKKLFGIFMGIPHVMVQGSISIDQVEVIHWGEPKQFG